MSLFLFLLCGRCQGEGEESRARDQSDAREECASLLPSFPLGMSPSSSRATPWFSGGLDTHPLGGVNPCRIGFEWDGLIGEGRRGKDRNGSKRTSEVNTPILDSERARITDSLSLSPCYSSPSSLYRSRRNLRSRYNSRSPRQNRTRTRRTSKQDSFDLLLSLPSHTRVFFLYHNHHHRAHFHLHHHLHPCHHHHHRIIRHGTLQEKVGRR